MKSWQTNSLILLFFLGACSTSTPKLINKSKVKVSEQPDPEALRYFMEGQLNMNLGNYAMAIVEFQHALLYDSNVSSIHLALADSYWMLKKTELSFSHMTTAMLDQPNDTEIPELMAKRYIALKQVEKAEDIFHQLSEQNPDSVKYIISLAELARLQNNYQKSIEYYQKAHKVDSYQPVFLEHAVELALKLKSESLTLSLLSQLITLYPTNDRYIENMINISHAFGNKDKTIWALKKMIKLKGQSSELLNQLGILYFKNEQPDSSINIFELNLKKDPSNPQSLHYLTLIYEGKGNYARAEERAKKLWLSNPDNPLGFTDLALLYLNQGQWEKAIDILRPVTDKFKSNFTIQYLTGLSIYQSEQKISAIPFYERALSLNPSNRNIMHNLAILYDSIKNWEKSDSLYTVLIETNLNDAQAYNNFAYSLAERGKKLDFALELSRIAVQLVPESAAYLDTMGWILFISGDNDGALIYIKQSIKIENNNSVVLEHLGDVLHANKNYSDAIHYWNKAFELDPKNEKLKQKINAP